MLFAGLSLARRLERAEATASARFVEARRRLQPDVNAEWLEVAGAYAMFDGPASPLSQTFGLGMFAPPSPDVLHQLEKFYLDRGAPVCHEVSPLAGVGCIATLVHRGYRPVEFSSIMHRAVEPSPETHPIHTRRMNPGEEQIWSSTSAEGWSDDPALREFLLNLGAITAVVEGTTAFFAEVDHTPIATASLHCADGVALFAGASTIPGARKQGAQSALLQCRMRHAQAVGCDLAMMGAAPGSASQRNAERQGFRIAYTRTKWQLDNPATT